MRHWLSIPLYGAIVSALIGQFLGRSTTAQAPSAPAVPVRVVTAAEKVRARDIYRDTGMPSDNGRDHLPDDQFDAALERRARTWVASLQATPVTGLQLDPMGTLYALAGRDSAAKQQFATRLATPRLSASDRVYTLLLAICAFGSSASDTVRMRTALEYVGMLDASASANKEKFVGHWIMAQTYYESGDGHAVMTQLQHAFALVPVIPFEDRNWLLFRQAFLLMADVFSGLSDGRRRIDALAEQLRPYTQAPAMLLAKDSAYYWMSRGNLEQFQQMLQMTDHLGRLAPPIVGHYWLNTGPSVTHSSANPHANIKALDDGTVRLIELGHYGCVGCVAALPKLDALRHSMPKNVEMWYVSEEGDVWGATPCRPPEMARHLEAFYAQKGIGLPMAIWIGPRTPDADGGSVIQESPTFAAYHSFGFPTFVAVDGRGIVRHISFGFSEDRLKRVLQYLIAEKPS